MLRRALGAPGIDFREGQWEAIEALVHRRERLLVIERTGWGKSAVYFIATRILRDRGQGPTLIVSPLLALMRNQVEAARRLGIRALTINSTNRGDWPQLRQDILADQADALIVSPERLANDEFVQTVLLPVAERLGLLVVDPVPQARGDTARMQEADACRCVYQVRFRGQAASRPTCRDRTHPVPLGRCRVGALDCRGQARRPVSR